jgi:hypothetical protein
MAQVRPLRECLGPDVVHTGVFLLQLQSQFRWGYHHVRSLFFVSVLETGHLAGHFYSGECLIPILPF